MKLDCEGLDVCHRSLVWVVLANDIIESSERGQSDWADQLTRASTSVVLKSFTVRILDGCDSGESGKPDKRRSYLTPRGPAAESAALLDSCGSTRQWRYRPPDLPILWKGVYFFWPEPGHLDVEARDGATKGARAAADRKKRAFRPGKGSPLSRGSPQTEAATQEHLVLGGPARWHRRPGDGLGIVTLFVQNPTSESESVQFASRGAPSAGEPAVRLACVSGAVKTDCMLGTTLAFEVGKLPAGAQYFGAFAQRSDGVLLWYFPGSEGLTPKIEPAAGLLEQAVVLGPPHTAGEYDVYLLFSRPASNHRAVLVDLLELRNSTLVALIPGATFTSRSVVTGASSRRTWRARRRSSSLCPACLPSTCGHKTVKPRSPPHPWLTRRSSSSIAVAMSIFEDHPGLLEQFRSQGAFARPPRRRKQIPAPSPQNGRLRLR